MVLHLLIGLSAGAAVAWWCAPAPVGIVDCFADHGIEGVTLYADGSVDVPVLVFSGNAGQAWDAHTDRIYDLCVP